MTSITPENLPHQILSKAQIPDTNRDLFTRHSAGRIAGEKAKKAEAGRTLALASEQDRDNYDSKQTNASAGGSFSSGSMSGSGSLNLSRDKMHSTYASVQEQTGIFAGKGGFDVKVGNHTQLDGAVIASTATPDKNRLDTGTLGWRDIRNEAEYQVEHQSVGVSSGGGNIGSQFVGNMANSLLTGVNGSDSASSTTKAAVSEGSIVIRDSANQQQNTAGLNREPEHANQTLSPIFDKEKEQNRLREAQLIGEIGSQVADIVHTQGKIIATKAANEKMSGITQADRDRALAELKEQDATKQYSEEDINRRVYDNVYNQAFRESGFGTGGAIQQGIQAATAVVQGLAGGDLAKALAGGAGPYIATVIKNTVGEENKAANLMAHAAVNAALALAKGENALAGAAGAATGEAVGMIAQSLYGKGADALSETERETVSALATLAAGLAGGLAGDSTGSAVSGAQAGKTTVENNALSSTEARALDKELSDCKASGSDCRPVLEKYLEISNKNSKELVDACSGGGVSCVTWEELIQGATNIANDAHPSQIRLDEKLKDPDAAALVNYLNGTDLKFLKDNITKGDRLLSVVSDPTSWPVVITAGKAIMTNNAGVKEQLIAAGVSSAANTAIQYGTSKTGEVKLSDVIGAGVIGLITAGKGYNPTVMWNAAGGYYQAEIKGDDPFMAGMLSTAGSGVGYTVGNIIKVPFDKVFNPTSKQYEWVPTGVWTISKPVPQSSVPSVAGNVTDSLTSGLLDKIKSNGSGEKK